MKKIEWRYEFGRYVPYCPNCKEPAYKKDHCVFCGSKYKWCRVKLLKVKFHKLFSRHWFVFPLCIEWHNKLLEYYEPATRLDLHFLWWHIGWTFWRGD